MLNAEETGELHGQDGRSLFEGDPFLLMGVSGWVHERENTDTSPVASGQGQPAVGADRVLERRA